MLNTGRNINAVQQHVGDTQQMRQRLLFDASHGLLQRVFVVDGFDVSCRERDLMQLGEISVVS